MEEADDELEMFVEAQDTVWPQVEAELSAGRKTGHWMWFVFPQLAELGQSDMAQLYGLHDLDEATAYLAHPTLRERLDAAARLILKHAGTHTAEDILGATDALKLRSSMTLFSRVPGAPAVFADVLAQFYDDTPCPATVSATG